jgi:lipopolysaccharide transport system permease protein
VNPHQKHSTSLLKIARKAWTNRSLILTLTRREIEGRYKGSMFGTFWSFLSPILILGVFTFVFGSIFQAKWSTPGQASQSTNHIDFATALFIGLLLYNLLAECINQAPTLITSNPNYVKRIVFPLELLSIVKLLAAIFHFLIALLVVLVLISFSTWSLSWTAFFMPMVVMPFFLLILGLTWSLSALGVYLRDIGQIVTPVLTATMFLSPLFYPLSSVSPNFIGLYKLNPLTYVIEESRNILLYGKTPAVVDWTLYTLIALAVAYGGLYIFQRTRHGFSDVI